MSLQHSPKQLAKFLKYVLGRRPDEFGLVTDTEGYVKIKELIKATSEEDGLGYVRRSHIDEILIALPNHGLEVKENLIRVRDREHLPKRTFALDPPKLLYTCIRKKAYPFVLNRGIKPTGFAKIVLSSRRDLARRMGRRRDHSAVLLTVQVGQAEDKGVVFLKAGEALFLADFIPPDCFSGPPLPKDQPDTRRADKPLKEAPRMPAGSFLLDLNHTEKPAAHDGRQKKRNKRHKPRRERPPWRR
jgi:putative RNA 2'-phosphotransferase